jgi:hypothetical protein
MILQSTPVLFVEEIAASEHFFAKLGFARTVEVAHGDNLGFVIMTQGGAGGGDGGIGVMLQTPASAADDTGLERERFKAGAHLFMSVADLHAVEKALAEFEVYMPQRDTFYGATEIGWREPGGNHITIAQFAANSPDGA